MTNPQPTIVIQQPSRWWPRLLLALLLLSLLVNIWLYFSSNQYYGGQTSPNERFHSGELSARNKIALLKMVGTISPPFTERLISGIEAATKDDSVKGVLLEVDSPGGFVADSHQIYTRLKRLSKKKPVYVAMKRLAASGGYYISMGGGSDSRIFAEPTTWTGSIGVIIPRYNIANLASRYGVKSDSLMTGEFKDSLNPLRNLTDRERGVWDAILDDSYQRFVSVIADNRPGLDSEAVTSLATGQIYTARQALENGLVDELGYVDDAIDALREKLGLTTVRVVTYYTRPGLIDVVIGAAEAKPQTGPLEILMEASVPRAMYYCSGIPLVPPSK